jgi:hypothetical protein
MPDPSSSASLPARVPVLVAGAQGPLRLTRCFGRDFLCLVFGDAPPREAVTELTVQGIAVLDIPPQADSLGQARLRFAPWKGFA